MGEPVKIYIAEIRHPDFNEDPRCAEGYMQAAQAMYVKVGGAKGALQLTLVDENPDDIYICVKHADLKRLILAHVTETIAFLAGVFPDLEVPYSYTFRSELLMIKA